MIATQRTQELGCGVYKPTREDIRRALKSPGELVTARTAPTQEGAARGVVDPVDQSAVRSR